MARCRSCDRTIKHGLCGCRPPSSSGSEHELQPRVKQGGQSLRPTTSSVPPSAYRPPPSPRPSGGSAAPSRSRRSSISLQDQPYVPKGGSQGSIGKASYSSSGGKSFDNSAFNAPRPNSYDINDGYNNVNYTSLKDARYANTGPAYDASKNPLSERHRKAADDARAAGRGDLADRFTKLSVDSGRISGNHSDQRTYERDSEYRTGSDQEDHDHYKREQKRRVDPLVSRIGAAKQAAPIKGKQRAESHLDVADLSDQYGRGHASVASGRMNYMEKHEYGLSDSKSHRTHVTAIEGNLKGMTSSYGERDSRRALAVRRDLDHSADRHRTYEQTVPNGYDSLDRPSSGSTMQSARTGSGVSSTHARESTSSRGNTEHRCEHRSSSSGKQCPRYTTSRSRKCGDHR